MSASEKLRALEEPIRSSSLDLRPTPEMKTVLMAVPQILALVEAAESAREIEDYVLSEYAAMVRDTGEKETELQRALSALDEALP